MPTIPSGSKVLVSGASGYIAAWVVRSLLDRGYTVRGTVRSESKGQFLSQAFGEKFEYVIVEDIMKDGAFDEAVKGVDAIEHTASPFYLDNIDDPQELIGPAVRGTRGILESALKNGTSVKRIVITSSCAAVLSVHPTPKVFSELNWNEQALKIVEESGKNAPNIAKYRASKTLAEKAAWQIYNENKGKVAWDLVVINPPFVFGPVIHDVKNPESLGTSAKDWYKVVIEGNKSDELLATTGMVWVDVRDLAEAHSLVLEKEAAGGERIIVAAGPVSWQDWVDAANSVTTSRNLRKGVPGGGKNMVHPINYDVSKAKRILGLNYKTMEETASATLADFDKRGW
ncbi:hypothetical protein C8J56DRAFT_16655 [Mycena floridula]|nr:hypothetical protein C8J56DRAFT_16655 [Mycena floridula]